MAGTQVSTVQNKVREDFSETAQPRKWLTRKMGTGMAIDWSPASGMRITTGTTPNQETILRYVEPFETPVRAMFAALGSSFMNQRIANQEVELRLASADGTEYASWVFDGTVPGSAKMRSANEGVGAADSSITVPDTNTGSAVFELELWIDEVYWHARQADSTNARSASAVRNRRVPDPHTALYLEIAVKNLGTAPSSSTVVSLDAITIQDISEMTAEITGGRGGGAASQSIPVSFIGAPAVAPVAGSEVAPRIVYGATDPITSTNLIANALYTQPSVDLSTNTGLRPTRHRVAVMHLAGLNPGTLILEQSNDAAAWRETWRCPIPSDGAYHTFDIPQHLRYYRWKFQNGATAQTGLWLSDELVRGEGPTDPDKVLTFPLTAAAGQALALSATFTSPTVDLGTNHLWDAIRCMVKSDQASAAGGIQIQQSNDGVNWLGMHQGSNGVGNSVPLEAPVIGRYVRLVYVNGATAATNFYAALTLRSL